MIKTVLRQKNISMYRLSQKSKVPYSTINDLANYKLPVEKLRCGQLFALSEALGMTMDELYQLCRYTCDIFSEKYKESGKVVVKHKMYYLVFYKNGIRYEDKILPVKREATSVIQELAKWTLEEHLSKIMMEDAYEAVHPET